MPGRKTLFSGLPALGFAPSSPSGTKGGRKRTGRAENECSRDLELPPIGWQLFILGSSQSYSTAFPTFLDTCATRLLAEPLNLTFGGKLFLLRGARDTATA